MILIAFQPDEVLQIRVFDNLLDRFPVRQLQTFLNDECPEGDTDGNGLLSTKRFAEGLGILFLCMCPRYQPSQLDPAIFFTQLAAKRQEKIIGENEGKSPISLHMISMKTRQNPCGYSIFYLFSSP